MKSIAARLHTGRSLVTIMLLSLSGCGVINGREGGQTVYAGLGVRWGAPSPQTVSTKEMIVGIWVDLDASDHVTDVGAGFRKRSLVALPEGCRVVFIIENPAQLNAASEITRNLYTGKDAICTSLR